MIRDVTRGRKGQLGCPGAVSGGNVVEEVVNAISKGEESATPDIDDYEGVTADDWGEGEDLSMRLAPPVFAFPSPSDGGHRQSLNWLGRLPTESRRHVLPWGIL